MFAFGSRPGTHCVGLRVARNINGCTSKHRLCMFGIPNARDCLPNSVGGSGGVSAGSLASCVGCAKLHHNSDSFSCIDTNSVGQGNLVSTCSVSIITARLRSNVRGPNASHMTKAVFLSAPGRACGTNRAIRVAIGNSDIGTIGTLDFTLPCSRRSCSFINVRPTGLNAVRGLACSHLRADNRGTLCPAFIGLKSGRILRNSRSLFAVGLGAGHGIAFGLGTISNVLISGGLGVRGF